MGRGDPSDRSVLSGAPSLRSRFRGCLLGGAVGDALGAPVEFLHLAEIRHLYGPAGIRAFDLAFGVRGAITDDTQMTLFGVEALLEAYAQDAADLAQLMHRSYLDWLDTQHGGQSAPERTGLVSLPGLRQSRAPGRTCISALASGRAGTPSAPLNDSKGCGGIMRVAPMGLVGADPFALGCAAAAITHGHPSGYLAAGFFAQVIAEVTHRDRTLEEAIDSALPRLTGPDSQECLSAIAAARELARSSAPATPESVEQLGGGWVAEEALAIALYAALAAPTVEEALALAVNHSGDSDSTGALVGNLLGALYGEEALPDLRQEVELADLVAQCASDLYARYREKGALGGRT